MEKKEKEKIIKQVLKYLSEGCIKDKEIQREIEKILKQRNLKFRVEHEFDYLEIW